MKEHTTIRALVACAACAVIAWCVWALVRPGPLPLRIGHPVMIVTNGAEPHAGGSPAESLIFYPDPVPAGWRITAMAAPYRSGQRGSQTVLVGVYRSEGRLAFMDPVRLERARAALGEIAGSRAGTVEGERAKQLLSLPAGLPPRGLSPGFFAGRYQATPDTDAGPPR